MEALIFFALFLLICLAAPFAGADSRKPDRRGWHPLAKQGVGERPPSESDRTPSS